MNIFRFLIGDKNVYLYNKKRKWKLSRESFELIIKELERNKYGDYSNLLIENDIFPKDIKQLKYVKSFYSCKPQVDNIMIAITEDCNLNCKYCYNQGFNRVNSRKIPLNLMKDIIDKASDEGVVSLCITGGEPTQHKNFIDIINYIDNKGLSYTMKSNLLINNNDILEAIGNSNINEITVGLDTNKEDVHEYLTGEKNSLSLIFDNIRYLVKCDIKIKISIVLNKLNIENLEDFILFIEKDLNCSAIIDFMILSDNNKYKCDIDISISDYVDKVIEILSRKTRKFEYNKIDSYCGFAKNMIYINGDGEVMLCPSDPLQIKLGSIYENSLRNLYDKMIKTPYYNLSCHNTACKYLDFCQGGCRTRAVLLNGDINAPDSIFCDFFERIEIINKVDYI